MTIEEAKKQLKGIKYQIKMSTYDPQTGRWYRKRKAELEQFIENKEREETKMKENRTFTKEEYEIMFKYYDTAVVARDKDTSEILGVFPDMKELRKVLPGAEIVCEEKDYGTTIVYC